MVRRLCAARDKRALASGMKRIRVVAGIVERAGQVLCACRGPSQDQAGLWEFPGGKVEPGEDDATALVRELREELGIEVGVGQHVKTALWSDGQRWIELVGYRCILVDGEPTPREHAEIRWVEPGVLQSLDWAPADLPIVAVVSERAACT